MLTSYGRSPSAKNDTPGLKNLRTLAPLRVGAGLVLLFLYGLEAAVRAYEQVWKHVNWPLIATLGKAGVPYPDVLGPVAAGMALIVAGAWITGFLTRLFSFLFLPVITGAIIVVERLNAENQAGVCWLFLFITVTLIMYGSGLVSLDALFHLGSRPKKKKGY
ncbi:MAG: DoxX protein [Verrucomicrobiaceae bacterium]|nr:DoxX protein [Verrucomicrobiaceae bacterium]